MRWAPIADAEINGGYSRFSGDRLEGPNGSLLVVPGMRFGDSLSLLPILSADYQKARDVEELAGGGFFTVAQHSRGASLRAVQEAGPLKLKAYGAYREQLLKDTTDEPLGQGLFDNRKVAGGVEVEGKTPFLLESWRAGLDYYVTKFPHFVSLASQQGGAEIDTGEHVLNFNAVDLPLSAVLARGRQRLEVQTLASFRRFPEQNVVHEDTSFSGNRRDLYSSLSAAWTRILPKSSVLGGLESALGVDAAYNRLDSNQNSFDVVNTVFRPHFYSYAESSAGPRCQFRWKGWMTGGLTYSLALRSYSDRPAQDAAGLDKGAPIRSRTQTFRWTLNFPLTGGFSARLQGATQHADSNMRNETTYRYNYTSANYFAGIAYEL